MKNILLVSGITFFIMLSIFLLQAQIQVKKKQANSGSSADCSKDTGIRKVVCLAEAFKATLKDDQVLLLQLTYSKEDAAKWSNFPQGATRPKRVGISLGALTPTQLSAAKALMAAVLGKDSANEGYDEMEGILAADDYFGKTLGKTDMFGSNNYYIAFLGKPSPTALWELQFGGHHFAFANTYNDGRLIGVTPSFRGVEPMMAIPATGRTYQPMEQERRDFARMIETLSSAEKNTAKLSVTFADVLLGPGKDGQFPTTKIGISVGDLKKEQQQIVLKAIERYVADLDAATAKQIMAKYRVELANTYLAYSGSGTMNAANDYVRIDGPSVWIEYSAQPSRDFPGTTHPHSVWRNHTSDYGGN